MAPSSEQSFPSVSRTAGAARQRAARYNRARGRGGVKLKVERPAGSQRVIVKIKPVVHAKVSGGGGGGGSLMRHELQTLELPRPTTDIGSPMFVGNGRIAATT